MKKYLFFLLFFPLFPAAQGQTDSLQTEENYSDSETEEMEPAPYTPPPLKPVAMREIKAEDWKKATKELDYSKDLPKAEKAPEPAPVRKTGIDWTNATKGLGNILQILAIILGITAIGYAIYRLMQAPQNRVISRDGTEITLANIEEYIHETDLERFIREALAASDWPLAVRLYFLQAIKLLSEKNAIAWSKEKTNREYLREMSAHPSGNVFRDLTREYERIWYGNQSLTREHFSRLESEFKAFYGRL